MWTIIVRTQGQNNSTELRNALDSLVAQSYQNISIILTIHSNKQKIIDETLQFIKSYEDILNIKALVIKDRQGNRSYPLNAALKELDSEYVSFLDYDDIYYPKMGSLLISLLEKEKKTFAVGRSIKVIQEEVVDVFGNRYLYTKNKSYFNKKPFNKIAFFIDNYIPFNTFVIRTSLMQDEYFDEKLDYLEDWDWLRRLVLKENFSLVQTKTPVSEYRVRNDNTDTFNLNNSEKWEESRKKTDYNIENQIIKVSMMDILEYKEEYHKQIKHLNNEIYKLELNPAYTLWRNIRDNKIVSRTLVKFIRFIRAFKEE